jgi:deoxyribonuclease V
MRIARKYGWTTDTKEAKQIQLELAGEISRDGKITEPKFIAGVDISVNRWSKTGRAAVVVLSYPSLEIIEISTFESDITFPYVPGLLSFREMPLIIPAIEKLKTAPDLIIMDGQGVAHPRRIGIASHLGLVLGIPTIGCAKSRLIGEFKEPAVKPGNWNNLTDRGEVIGAVLRTKEHVKPVYVSTGHMIDLESAVYWIMACCRGYRLPEPTRLAHQAAGGYLGTNNQDTIASQ